MGAEAGDAPPFQAAGPPAKRIRQTLADGTEVGDVPDDVHDTFRWAHAQQHDGGGGGAGEGEAGRDEKDAKKMTVDELMGDFLHRVTSAQSEVQVLADLLCRLLGPLAPNNPAPDVKDVAMRGLMQPVLPALDTMVEASAVAVQRTLASARTCSDLLVSAAARLERDRTREQAFVADVLALRQQGWQIDTHPSSGLPVVDVGFGPGNAAATPALKPTVLLAKSADGRVTPRLSHSLVALQLASDVEALEDAVGHEAVGRVLRVLQRRVAEAIAVHLLRMSGYRSGGRADTLRFLAEITREGLPSARAAATGAAAPRSAEGDSGTSLGRRALWAFCVDCALRHAEQESLPRVHFERAAAGVLRGRAASDAPGGVSTWTGGLFRGMMEERLARTAAPKRA
ncbi:unnamed protein product [Pedinophyceae sp. YPF-701]|nr:unnamed protein product [Pedinophyceae sp. YPF-701]